MRWRARAAPAPASLVLVSPAVRIHAAAGFARLKDAMSGLPGLDSLAWLSIMPEFDPYRYNSFATNAATVVHELTRSVDARLASTDPSLELLPPILVFKSTVDSTVTTDAVVDRLLARLGSERHELVLFDINRFAAKAKLLIDDPAPLTQRLQDADDLPFAVTFVANESPDSQAIVVRYKPPLAAEARLGERLDLRWPEQILSLSHVALPFPPDDPLYGRHPPDDPDVLFLGEMALRGERGLLTLPGDWLLRMRYNPFYELLEQRAIEWLAASEPSSPRTDRP